MRTERNIGVRAGRRRASALLVVLWAVIALSLIITSFAFTVRTHVRIAANYSNDASLRNIASAGVELAVATLKADEEPVDHLAEEWANGESVFFEHPIGDGHFSLVRAGLEEDSPVAYGIEDEASKINLRTATRSTLVQLPGMDEELADCLLDWQDEDSEPRSRGAEAETYFEAGASYSCKNAPLDSIPELLLVRGFDATVVYGEDWNTNGVLDPNENDGDASEPPDNEDGFLERGIYPYVTVHSTDKNVTVEGEKRVDIASASASELRRVIPDLTSQEAKAIVSYRSKKAFKSVGELLRVTAESSGSSGSSSKESKSGSSSRSRGSSSSRSRSKSDETDEKKIGVDDDEAPELEELELEEEEDRLPAKQTSSRGGGWSRSGRGSSSRSSGSSRSGGASSSGASSGGSSKSSSSSSQGARVFSRSRVREIIDYCKVGGEDTAQGRVNINTASAEVLQALPAVSRGMARRIVEFRQDGGDSFSTIGDLLNVSGMSESAFIYLAPHVTVRSYQFRVQSVASIENVKRPKTVCAVLDRSGDSIKTIYWREY